LPAALVTLPLNGGGAAGEGDGAVVGQAAAAEDAEAGDLAGVVEG